ncbi:MAG: ubiquinol oxidase subunit II [bacterium]|nr:ubiquinol oxidase subunit II [bacterium]
MPLKFALSLLITLGIVSAFWFLLRDSSFDVLQAKGLVAAHERNLIVYVIVLMLIVVIPVFALAFFFAWRYRAGNTDAVYMPNWEHAKVDELIWWAIPFEIILVLGALTWTSTHELDPHRPLDALRQYSGQAARGEPLKVQVVALDWKWLFIYPEYGIASVNFMQFPVDRAFDLSVTADAPMNSFWIPQLGGQIYAMTGMVTQLHLIADEVGRYDGVSANYSGDGFAYMKFVAKATSQEDFDAWIQEARQSPYILNVDTYVPLTKPSIANVIYYGSVQNNFFDSIVMKFTSTSPHSPTKGNPLGSQGLPFVGTH